MADLFWSIELLRMKDVGVAHHREGGRRPLVEKCPTTVEGWPAIRPAVAQWPGARF